MYLTEAIFKLQGVLLGTCYVLYPYIVPYKTVLASVKGREKCIWLKFFVYFC